MGLNFSRMQVHHIRFSLQATLIISAFVLFASCGNNSMNECSYHYITSINDFCVNGKLIDSNEVNNRFIFYKSDGITFSEAGFFRNGFRNAKWQYEASGDLKTIEWAYFSDSATMVETNVFSYADSVKYEPGRCKLKFLTDSGFIILSMTVNGLL